MTRAAIILLLSIGSAAAVEQPPARYRHAFAGQVVVDDHWGGEISAIGGPCYPWMGARACAQLVGGVCRINAMRGKMTPALLEHETAHCNGWAADHPK